MKKNTIVHLYSIYLKLPFIYFLINSLKKNNYYFLVREIKKGELEKFPYDKVIQTNKIFYPFWLINKILSVKFNFMIGRFPIDQICKIRKLGKIDLLHAHFGFEGYYALGLAKYFKVPLIVTFYGFDMSDLPKKQGWKKRYKKLFREVSAICVEGEFMKTKMIELGCAEDKVHVLRLAIPTEKIKFSYRPHYENSLNVLMCASFVEKKGYFDAIETIKRLKDEGININCEIIGDGSLKNQIEERINFLNLSDVVKLLGRKNSQEIYDISKKHHVFFHPSKFASDGGSEGGAPTIISEMQALGLPIISTDHADIPNIIPNENKFLAMEGNVDQLVDCFKRLIAVKSSWERISVSGRKFVEENHNADLIGNKMEQIYDDTIHNFKS